MLMRKAWAAEAVGLPQKTIKAKINIVSCDENPITSLDTKSQLPGCQYQGTLYVPNFIYIKIFPSSI